MKLSKPCRSLPEVFDLTHWISVSNNFLLGRCAMYVQYIGFIECIKRRGESLLIPIPSLKSLQRAPLILTTPFHFSSLIPMTPWRDPRFVRQEFEGVIDPLIVDVFEGVSSR